MHGLYVESFNQSQEKNEKNILPLTYQRYRDVFYKYFNIKVKPLKTDTCGFCDRFNNLAPALKLSKKIEIDEHWAKVNRIQMEQEEDIERAKKDPTFAVVTFDMQKTHALPDLSTSENYYKRHLNVFIRGINNAKDEKGKLINCAKSLLRNF